MSRPPYPHPARSTGREQTGDLDRLDYLPLEYADLLALQEELAVTRLGRPLPEPEGDAEEADVARTFMELSALVGHVLSVYQRHYAGEAFISTAQAPSSLVRHAHRLAYDPDPGARRERLRRPVREGARRRHRRGRPAAGERAAGRDQGAGLRDRATTSSSTRRSTSSCRSARGSPCGSRPTRTRCAWRESATGSRPATPSRSSASARGAASSSKSVTEDLGQDVTTVRLTGDVGGASFDVADIDPPPVAARAPGRDAAAVRRRRRPALFPPGALKAATGTKPARVPEVLVRRPSAPTGSATSPTDVYLSEQVGRAARRRVRPALDRRRLARCCRCTAEVVAAVTINREVEEPFTTPDREARSRQTAAASRAR